MAKDNSTKITYTFREIDYPVTSIRGGGNKEGKIIELTTLTKTLKQTLKSAGLEKWEITLEGYLEANTGILPGGKAGFKASIKLSDS